MAALFDLDHGKVPRSDVHGNKPGGDPVGAAFGLITDHLLDLPAEHALRRIESFRGVLDSTEAQILAGMIGDDGDTRRAESAAGCTGRTSKRARKRKANRAKAVRANSSLADKMADGDMSGEQVDVIADAANKTDGAAAIDEELIDEVAATDPDQGAKVADRYVADRTDAGQAQSRHDRQRRRRRARRFATDDGCVAILLKGDSEAIEDAWTAAMSTARAFYATDGGRDVPHAQHPRTADQRLFDAFIAHITGKVPSREPQDEGGNRAAAMDGSGSGSSTEPTGPTDADRLRSAPRDGAEGGVTGDSTGTCEPRTASGPIQSKRYTPAKTRPTIVVSVTLEKFLGLDPDQAAELIGIGSIADSVLAEYLAADADVVGAVFGQSGQPLWLSRRARYANRAQLIALIIRDKGCVLCGKAHQHCDAHHLTPWNAPARGETDITKLALVCGDCHRRLHDNNQTLYQTPLGHWKLRPATPTETPPQRFRRGRTPARE